MSDPYGVGALIGGVAQGFAANRMYSASNLSTRHAREYQDWWNRNRYQVTVKDLRKAGLNPALAYMGASPPSGMSSPTTQGPDYAGVGKALEGLGSSVKEYQLLAAELKRARAEAKDAENRAAGSSWSVDRALQELRESRSRTAANLSQSLLADAQRVMTGAHTDVFSAQKALLGIQTSHESAKERATRLAIPYSPEQMSLLREQGMIGPGSMFEPSDKFKQWSERIKASAKEQWRQFKSVPSDAW